MALAAWTLAFQAGNATRLADLCTEDVILRIVTVRLNAFEGWAKTVGRAQVVSLFEATRGDASNTSAPRISASFDAAGPPDVSFVVWKCAASCSASRRDASSQAART